MRFLEIASALNAQAIRHETQAWLQAQATTTPRQGQMDSVGYPKISTLRIPWRIRTQIGIT